MDKRYFLCSSSVIEHFPKFEHSKPFKSGYTFDKDDYYYIAVIDIDRVSNYSVDVIEPFNEKSNIQNIDFWCRECVGGTMDASKITIAGMKRKGVFVEIEDKTSLTTEYNQAMVIFNLSRKYNCTPIELIEKVIG